MRVRKKPVIVNAVQWTGKNLDEVLAFTRPNEISIVGDRTTAEIYIPTTEGTMRADLMDWIIRGVKNELYPCKPDVFEATYDAGYVRMKRRTEGGY